MNDGLERGNAGMAEGEASGDDGAGDNVGEGESGVCIGFESLGVIMDGIFEIEPGGPRRVGVAIGLGGEKMVLVSIGSSAGVGFAVPDAALPFV
jgi:hypothetical protein